MMANEKIDLKDFTYMELLDLRKEVDAALVEFCNRDKTVCYCVSWCNTNSYYLKRENANSEAMRILSEDEGFSYELSLSEKKMTQADINANCLDLDTPNSQ